MRPVLLASAANVGLPDGYEIVGSPSEVAAGRWIIDVRAGEDWLAGIGVFAEAITRLDSDTDAVKLPRIERGGGVSRVMHVVRGFRAGAPGSANRTVVAEGIHLTVDRSRERSLIGSCEAAERDGDWPGAYRRWTDLADLSRGAVRAYCHIRAALAARGVAPTIMEGHLRSAVGASPLVPEAPLRLAAWCGAAGDTREAMAWGAVAEAVCEPAAEVPHLEGTRAWVVPAHLAAALADRDPAVARELALEAVRRGASDRVTKALAGGAEPAHHVGGSAASTQPAREEREPWLT